MHLLFLFLNCLKYAFYIDEIYDKHMCIVYMYIFPQISGCKYLPAYYYVEGFMSGILGRSV